MRAPEQKSSSPLHGIRATVPGKSRAERVCSAAMEDRKDSWTPAGQAERHDPLPSFLMLPVRGWRKLSRRGRLFLVAVVLAGALAIVASWPAVERDKRAGE